MCARKKSFRRIHFIGIICPQNPSLRRFIYEKVPTRRNALGFCAYFLWRSVRLFNGASNHRISIRSFNWSCFNKRRPRAIG